MKKALSVFLSAIICALIFVLSTPVAFAASYSGTCGNNARWSIDTLTGTLTISGTGATDSYSFNSAPSWDSYQSYIKSVVIENGITSVGDCLFYNGGSGFKYKKLESVNLGNITSIGSYAFRNCKALSLVTGTDHVTTVGEYAFKGCNSLKNINLNAVISINNGAFSECDSLEYINLLSTLTTVGSSAFQGCDSLKSITVPQSVRKIGARAYADCPAVLTVSFLPISAPSSLGEGIFSETGSESGTELNFSNSLTSVPDSLFCNSNISSLSGGNNLTKIGNNSFARTNLKTFSVSSKITSIGQNAFLGCNDLTSFSVNSSNRFFSSNSNGLLLNKDETMIIRYPAGKTDSSFTVASPITSLGVDAFRECPYLETVTFTGSVTTVKDSCFKDCPRLSTVTLNSKVTTINPNAFENCDSLNDITADCVTKIGSHAFAYCDAISDFSSWPKLESIDSYAFYNCNSLISVNITDGTAIRIGEYAFHNCANLSNVEIGSGTATISECAFSACTNITDLTLSPGVTYIGKHAFLGCSALMNVKIPSTVTTIEEGAFGYTGTPSSKERINNFKIICPSTSSCAYNYALSNLIPYEISSDSVEEKIIDNTDEETSLSPFERFISAIRSFSLFDFFKRIFQLIFNFAGN